VINTSEVRKQIIDRINAMDPLEISDSLHEGEFRIESNELWVVLNQVQCRVGTPQLDLQLKSPEDLRELSAALESRLGRNPFQRPNYQRHVADERKLDESGRGQHFRLNGEDLKAIPGLVRAENEDIQKHLADVAVLTKPTYTHEEIFGKFCFLGEHIYAPYQMVCEYMTNIHSLEEFTVGIRNLKHVGGGLYRGMDAVMGKHELFIRCESSVGPDQSVITFPCAIDQGHELWMRYHHMVLDAEKALGRPGTIVLWINCKHPYYYRSNNEVPGHVALARATATPDDPWIGDLWDVFYAAHTMELRNLKRILEYRFQARSVL
jgi:hypothetical protein